VIVFSATRQAWTTLGEYSGKTAGLPWTACRPRRLSRQRLLDSASGAPLNHPSKSKGLL
jgi:hypothetical protein